MPELQSSKSSKCSKKAFTLVEVMIALFILTAIAGSITNGIMSVRAWSEKTVFEATAHSIALGYLEQIKNSPDWEILEKAADGEEVRLITIIDGSTVAGSKQELYANKVNPIEVIIDRKEDELTNVVTFERKILGLQFTPTITNLADSGGLPVMEITMDYEWQDPETRAVKQRTLKSAKAL